MEYAVRILLDLELDERLKIGILEMNNMFKCRLFPFISPIGDPVDDIPDIFQHNTIYSIEVDEGR